MLYDHMMYLQFFRHARTQVPFTFDGVFNGQCRSGLMVLLNQSPSHEVLNGSRIFFAATFTFVQLLDAFAKRL
jgi:hypothetical protein